MEGIEPTTEPTPMKRRNRSSDSLDTAQQSHEVPIKKRRGSNRLVIIDPTSNAKDVYIGSSAYETTQTLAATLRDLQGRYTEMYKELTHLKDVERARYQYDVSLTFNKYFDPMNPDHMSWFRQFARQTMRFKSALQIIDEDAEPDPDYYINNPFNKNEALKLIKLLNQSIKKPKTSLKYRNHFTLLTSVVLSAQCTDVNVNNVTKDIYKKYYKPEHFVKLGKKKIKELIKSIGLFNNKAKNLYNLSKILINKHKSKVPNNFEDLIELPGVGRKTANVVLNAAFNKPTIAVDTHVFRVANRTGLSNGKNPENVEKQLLQILPKKYKKKAHHLILLHGRYICKARNPSCKICVINKICLYKKKYE